MTPESAARPALRLAAPATPTLPPFSQQEEVALEYEILGLPASAHALDLVRPRLERLGVRRSDELADLAHGTRVRVGGLLTCRQAPPTAKGHAFLTLEDEAGLVNCIVRPAVNEEHYLTIRGNSALIVDGQMQRKDGVLNVIATKIYPLWRPSSVAASETPSADND
ncbi:MAG: hypothetical protein M1401_14900 [Chloroflexi bacterium]|nr:hypothetical protein [Chloroflexota bacterium]MCL5110118.1 hypothetical protein [Chloroflexota bacterium]